MIRDAQIAYAPARPARKRERRRARARAGREGLPVELLGMLYFLLVVLAGGILVWQPARVAQVNERMAGLETSLQELRMRNESLKKSVSAIESLDYVEKEARTRLGMVSPQEVRTFSITETAKEPVQVASLPKEDTRTGGIFSLFGRIAQIFGVKQAIAKGQR
jgi:cell division protein FtsB